MSNEAKMTLEEKMVQTLKSDHLMNLVGDEDAITELVKRAISEALYQPQRMPRSYGGGYDQKDSLVVELSRDVARKAAESVSKEITNQLIEDEKFRATVKEAMLSCIPNIMMNAYKFQVEDLARQTADAAIERLRNEIGGC